MEVELIDYLGSDLHVLNAARVSFDKESSYQWDCKYCKSNKDDCWKYDDVCGMHGKPIQGKNILREKDKKLLRYLAEHNHWSPFSHCFVSLRIKAPIFVARQLGKHQVGLAWNEVSRRYVRSAPEFYAPEKWRKSAENVKQGSSDESFDVDTTMLFEFYKGITEAYEQMIEAGVCAEQARMLLPQSMYTTWIWSGSMYAFSRVCKLRLDPHTQRETQEIAKRISHICGNLFPESWAALKVEQ